ncbi:hypothetical protein NW762_012909 [Fusarium torreyae]|uniref:DUF7908 domain-containing protein n=1 Tax=Fusarium torreyae TaxID=1237075 RepID=A0A9W8VAY9_9HYPO|nr:hypothetical protein NW762_012909 [Fusarium torreyae]
MKWKLFLALGGPARAVAGWELIGDPQWNDGVVCYTYLSTYLAPVDAETAEPEFPTVPSFPTTRGIIPPYFSNRSTSVPPSALTEPSRINAKPTTGIDITTSDLAITTDDQDPVTPATGTVSLLPPTSVTATQAFTTSSEATSGQAVIFFVSPQTGDEKRDLVKREPGGFIGGDTTKVEICTFAATFRLAAGQLLDSQDPIYYNGEPYKEFRGQGTPPEDAITRQFSDVAGALVFTSRALPNTNAGFCQEPESGQVYITFTSSPPGCLSISLRVYAVEQCQDGRIIGLDSTESATTEPNQSSTIAETTNPASSTAVTFSKESSSTALTGQTSSAQLSHSSDSSSETIETTQSLGTIGSSASSTADETTSATSNSPPEDSSSFSSFSSSSPSTETPLSFTTSVEASITSKSFSLPLPPYTTTASSDSFSSVSKLSSDLPSSFGTLLSEAFTSTTISTESSLFFSSVSTISSDLSSSSETFSSDVFTFTTISSGLLFSSSSKDTLSSEPTSTLSIISSTKSATTSEVSTTASTQPTTTTEESTATTEKSITTTEEPTTLCNSVDPLTKVALANPTPVFNNNLYRDDDYASIELPWGQAGLAGTGQNTVFINTNGYITLDAGNTNPDNSELPTSFLVNRAFLPYWDDLVLDPSKGHTIVYEIFDGRFGVELVVEFILGKADNPDIYHFEANFLRDEPQVLRFQYYTTPDEGSSATAGFQNLLTGIYAQISYNQADILLDGASITLVTDVSNNFVTGNFDNTECGTGQDRTS